MMKTLTRAGVLSLATYGGYCLYQRYAPAARELYDRRQEGFGAVKEVKETAYDATNAVAQTAKQSIEDVIEETKTEAQEVLDAAHDQFESLASTNNAKK